VSYSRGSVVPRPSFDCVYARRPRPLIRGRRDTSTTNLHHGRISSSGGMNTYAVTFFLACLPLLIARFGSFELNSRTTCPSQPNFILRGYDGTAAGAPVPVPCPARLGCGGRKSGMYATPKASTAIPTEKYAGVPVVERCEAVSDSQLCVATRTAVQPIILLRVKMAAIGRVEDIVLVIS